MKKLFLITAMLGLLTGCAGFLDGGSEARLITQYATVKVITREQDRIPERADRVRAIAGDVRKYASTEANLTVALLVDQIRVRVPFDEMDVADKLLVEALLNELQWRLIERYGASPLPENLQLAATTVAGWVVDAANLVTQ